MTKLNLDGMSHVEMIGLIEELAKRIKTESFSEGYESGYEQAKTDIRRFQVNPFKLGECKMETPQAKRDRIVEQAKQDIEELKNEYDGLYDVKNTPLQPYACSADFIVNKEKRTVVALLRGKHSERVRAKGIAKCAPGDCFNVHIGKAISLRRALGLEVPAEYLNAPAPTEVRVGDLVRHEIIDDSREVSE